ncbi:MAG: acylphosphatase [Planctomycetes bacterium]|nr:acylphosphatase [Planctomycetota bacterium]
MGAVRRTVVFSGRVQGVGFRFTTCAVAERFDVTGFVRNLADGRVELVAEGAQADVEAFVSAVSDAMGNLIGETQIRDGEAVGEFSRFDIRY